MRPGPLAVTLLAAPAGGAALGLAVAWVAVKVRQRIDHPMLEITLSLVTPYLTYVLAEGAHLSGVLATVAAGVYVGSHLSRIFAALDAADADHRDSHRARCFVDHAESDGLDRRSRESSRNGREFRFLYTNVYRHPNESIDNGNGVGSFSLGSAGEL